MNNEDLRNRAASVRASMREPTPAEYQAALDDLVHRGIVTTTTNDLGQTVYHFPDAPTGERLLRESKESPQ